MFQEFKDLTSQQSKPAAVLTSAAVGSHVTIDATSLPVRGLNPDWLLAVLTFDNKDFLSRNRHHVNEIFQDDCGHR